MTDVVTAGVVTDIADEISAPKSRVTGSSRVSRPLGRWTGDSACRAGATRCRCGVAGRAGESLEEVVQLSGAERSPA